jgi:hypothetical protein
VGEEADAVAAEVVDAAAEVAGVAVEMIQELNSGKVDFKLT